MNVAERKATGGYAFPTETSGEYLHGMTLRDWFAGQALVGLLAAAPTTEGQADAFAAGAYTHADAMLVARERDQ